MVARKHTKAAKATYTDRVLGALSQIQQEKRSQLIHMATLRAKVRKNAEAQQDKLGAQWPHWVGKTVNKLVEEGVLHASDHSVRVSVTPKGKKLFTVRRSMDTGSASARGLHDSPTTVRKRGRRSTRTCHAEQELEGQDTPVSKKARLEPRTRKAKRAKLAEFESLHQSLSANFDLDREMSPLTDVEADDHGITAPMMATPQAHRLKGLVRTQSGSIIPDHSKQPTPAPSSPGWEAGGASYLDQDPFEVGPAMVQHNDEAAALTRELEQQKLAMDLMKQTSEKEKEAYCLKISHLEKQLSTFRNDYDQLRRQVEDTLNPRITSQMAEIEAKNQEITRLQTAQQGSSQTVVELEGQVEKLHALLSDYRATNAAAQAELATLRNTSSEQEATIRMKEQEAKDLQIAVATLQSSLAEMEGQGETYAAQVAVLDATVQELRTAISLDQQRLKGAEEQTMKLGAILENKEKEKSALDTTLVKIQEELDLSKQEAAQKENTVAVLNAEIQSLQLTVRTLRDEHQNRVSALEAALQDARTMLQQSEELKDMQLQEKESELTGVKERSKETLSLLRNDFRALRNSQMEAWKEMEARFEAIVTNN